MKPGPLTAEPEVDSLFERANSRPIEVPKFLVELAPARGVFLDNLFDFFAPSRGVAVGSSSAPGDFWPDVFVVRPPAWRRFAESLLYHAAFVAGVLAVSHFWPPSPAVVRETKFDSANVIHYEAPDYLPPLNTGVKKSVLSKKGEPELARQEIISVPAESDNRTQTIVAPPKLKLNHEVLLPNIVSAPSTLPVPSAVIAPPAERRVSMLAATIIPPPPTLEATHSTKDLHTAPGDAVAPQPMLAESSTRKLGDLNMARADVVAPAPKLSVSEQRLPGSGKPSLGSANVVAPSPAIQAGATSLSGGNLIALGIHPAPPDVHVEPPQGNRRGTFAATPNGKSGAPGTPEGSTGQEPASAASGQSQSGIPSGLIVGASPKSASPAAGGNSRLTADVRPPHVSSAPHVAPSGNTPTEIEKEVFGDRKFYSMTLNMPNLNSAGGSWVIHFAELKGNAEKGELSTPVPTHEVDPGYPLELMRQNVHGTVTLYAVIHADGSVGMVRLLSGIDDQLDKYAQEALSRWKFQPAMKNGVAVDLDAVVMIPFKPVRARPAF